MSKKSTKNTNPKAKPATPKTPRAKAPPKVRERDPRLPPVGTELTKRNRAGEVAATCTIVEAGVRYDGEKYKSLSAAAVAAAKALKLSGKTQNGFVFWGLARTGGGGPVEALERAAARYRDRAGIALRDGEHRAAARKVAGDVQDAIVALLAE